MNIKDVEGKVRMVEQDHCGDDAGQWAFQGRRPEGDMVLESLLWFHP